jgi:hypothetical protein
MLHTVEDSAIPLRSIDVSIPILTCSDCDRTWRADQPERCVYCAREYGHITQVIDATRRRQLFEAVRAIPLDVTLVAGDMRPFYKNQSHFEAELLDACPWYRSSDPLCTQACWFALQEICPWAHANPNASRVQAIWDDFLGEKPDVTVTESQLRYAALFFELDFQDCAHLILDEDPRVGWAAYCDAQAEEDDEIAAYLEDQIELHGI